MNRSILPLCLFAPLLFAPLARAETAVRPAAKPRPATVLAKTRRTAPRVVELLRRVRATSAATRTMTADFEYSVTSVSRQQFVAGSVRLRKPNLARITFSYVAQPAFPTVFASDGKTVYTATSNRFNRAAPYAFVAGDPAQEGIAASGGAGSTVSTEPAAANGSNIRLWDSVAVQAVFDPDEALSYLYFRDVSDLRYAGEKTENGVRYRIIAHTFKNGITGGERTPFEQQVYIDPNNRIPRYTLEFRSGGHTGVQVMRLFNIRVNDAAPLTAADFAATN